LILKKINLRDTESNKIRTVRWRKSR